MYGLGYSQFALKNYKSSIATQQKVLDLYPESPNVPDAMLNMANSQIQLGLVPGAKKTLRDLIAKFPNSEVTPTAQKRLKALEAIK
jgi:TolA-binding protein